MKTPKTRIAKPARRKRRIGPGSHAKKFGAKAKACWVEVKRDGLTGPAAFKAVGACMKGAMAPEKKALR